MGIISLIVSLFSEWTTRVLVNQKKKKFTYIIKLERELLKELYLFSTFI